MTHPNLLSISEALLQIREGKLAPREIQEACFQQIERLNPRLNAFITVIGLPDGRHPAPGESKGTSAARLAGIPIAVKDLFDTVGVRTTGGSRFFKDNVPASDAEVVLRLRAAGALIMGKTNTHEIALGVTTANPHFGACLNPWDDHRIPGGSSGGSAVAVATGMALGAVGTDTGGSIRIPASLCGVVGLKPTYGRVSLRGVMPLSWNLDHAGPITRTVRDAALVLQVIAGFDRNDPQSVHAPPDDLEAHLDDGVHGWHIALGTGAFVDAADSDILQGLHDAAQLLREAGAQVTPVEISVLHRAALANGLMTQADGAAYHRERLAEHPDWFGDDVRRRLEAGRDLAVADYVLARRTQDEVKHQLAALFEDYDILLLPSTPNTAPPIAGGDAVEQARKLTRFTSPFNLAGLPAISIPCGFDRQGLPIGLQMIAGAWKETALLQAARAYESRSGWSGRWPPAIF